MTLVILLGFVLLVGGLIGVLAKMPPRQILVQCLAMVLVALSFYGLAQLL